MYFIQSGVCEVYATDGETVIVYLTEGCYFGEIGMVLQDKRSVSVKAIEFM
jgi:CRP-like cAMP-binding protein